jgi:hypothetical protein
MFSYFPPAVRLSAAPCPNCTCCSMVDYVQYVGTYMLALLGMLVAFEYIW